MKNRTTFILLILLSYSKVVFSQLNEVDAPVENFEKLWKVFADRYANFDLKQVNWIEIREKYRPLINEQTTNKQLFEVCCAMLHELDDGHVTIEPDFAEEDIACGPPYEFSLASAFNTSEKYQQFEAVMDLELIRNGFSKPIHKHLSDDTNFQYRISDLYAYLRLDEMTEKVTFGKFKRAVDGCIKAFQLKEGLIIDLRFNGGGWDNNAYKLASRFIPKGRKTGHFERERMKGTEQYTPLKHKVVKSKGKYQFTKPIIILTSDFTASAAEVFLLIMNELPHVTIVGDHTEGIFSDMYEFSLPNKWEVSLSHQQYFSADKENFEGIGIAPDVKILNSSIDIINQTDPLIQSALNHLAQATKIEAFD